MPPARSFMRKRFPTLYSYIACEWRNFKKRKRRRLLFEYTNKYGWIINRGPFKGQLVTQNKNERLPILIGSYEEEIHEWIERIILTPYSTIINIGAGTGLYAVGFARRMSDVQILAYEEGERNREICKKNAILNDVQDRIEIRGICTPDELENAIENHANERILIVCDCEGCEFELFRSPYLPTLKSVDLLIELHRHKNVHSADLFISNLKNDHRVEIMEAREKNPSNYPELSFLSQSDQILALIERRPADGSWQWINCHSLNN